MDESPVSELERAMQRFLVMEFNHVHGSVASVRAFCGDETGARNEQVGFPLTHVGRGVSFACYAALPTDWYGHAVPALERDVELARIYAVVLRSVSAAELHRSQFTDAELERVCDWVGLGWKNLGRTALCVELVRAAARGRGRGQPRTGPGPALGAGCGPHRRRRRPDRRGVMTQWVVLCVVVSKDAPAVVGLDADAWRLLMSLVHPDVHVGARRDKATRAMVLLNTQLRPEKPA